MTFPGQVQQMGGSRPPLEDEASRVLAAARQRMEPRPRPPVLTAAERKEAEDAAKEAAKVCPWCMGLHPLPGGPGCPRLASVELDGDGKIKAATFWPGRKWAKGRVTFVEDAFEDEESSDAER